MFFCIYHFWSKVLNLGLNRIFSLPSTIWVFLFYHFFIWVCFYRVIMRSLHGVFLFVIILPYLSWGLADHIVFLLIPSFPMVTTLVIGKSPESFFEMLQGILLQNLKIFTCPSLSISVKHQVVLWNVWNLGQITTEMK